MEQRLRRDAADIQAGAADILLLDDADARAQLRRANRGDIAADTRADHHDVKLILFCSHDRLLNNVASGAIAGKNSQVS